MTKKELTQAVHDYQSNPGDRAINEEAWRVIRLMVENIATKWLIRDSDLYDEYVSRVTINVMVKMPKFKLTTPGNVFSYFTTVILNEFRMAFKAYNHDKEKMHKYYKELGGT